MEHEAWRRGGDHYACAGAGKQTDHGRNATKALSSDACMQQRHHEMVEQRINIVCSRKVRLFARLIHGVGDLEDGVPPGTFCGRGLCFSPLHHVTRALTYERRHRLLSDSAPADRFASSQGQKLRAPNPDSDANLEVPRKVTCTSAKRPNPTT